MPVFKIPVNWEVYGIMEIEASDIEEAIKKADNYPYPPIEDNTGSQEVNFELIEHLNPGVEVKSNPNLGIVNIRCPKCGEFLYRTEADGLWCRRKCYESELKVWEAVEKSFKKS